MSKKIICVDCSSEDVHYIEFRTDYTTARFMYPMNDNEEIDNEDLPLHLNGYYCHQCKSFSSIKTSNE